MRRPLKVHWSHGISAALLGVQRAMSRNSVQCIAAVAVIGVAWLAPTAVEAQPRPDLVVPGPNVSETSVETGETFWFIATVTNDGDAQSQSAATTVRYLRSTDATITESDTEEGTDEVRALLLNQGYAATIRLTAPSTAGTYYYGACVDAVAGESDTTNNCSTSVQVEVSAPATGPTAQQEVEPKPPGEVQAVVDEAVARVGGLRAGGAHVTIELNTLFSFRAGASADTTYTVRSSDPELVTAETTDGQLVLTPGGPPPAGASSSLAAGATDTLHGDPARATITVAAERAGDTAEVEFTVEVLEPELEPLGVEIVGVPDVAVAGESYELTAQSDAEEALVYAWLVAYGGAIEPDDTQMVVWTAPETAGVAWIRVDATREEDGATAGQSAYVRVEVPDQTTLTLSADPAPAEGGEPVTVTATLDNPAPANGLTVTLTTSGTATLDTDYTLSSTTITIAEGETAGTVTITVTDDAEDDDGETIVIDAESTSPALTADQLTLTIEDNDMTPVPALPLRGVLLLGLLLTLLGAVLMRMRTDIARGY